MTTAGADLLTPEINILTGEAMKWAKAIDGWTEAMRAAGMRPLTIELRRYQIGALAEAHLRRSPWSVRTTDLLGWLAQQNWSPATRKSYRAALRSFFGWARKAGHIKRNPTEDLPPVRVPHGLPRPAPKTVVEQALGRADDRARLILLLAGYAGLRRAEIAQLRWADINDGELRIVGKGGHVRTVPIHSILAAELDQESARRQAGTFGTGWRYNGHPGSTWVFPGRSGGPSTAEAIGSAAARALGDGYTGHQLRHSFATRVLEATDNLGATQQLLGHASPATTRIYARTSARALRAAIDKL